MRAAVIATLAALITMLAGAGHAAADRRFCIIPGGTAEGSGPDCRFDTLEQCRASRDGTQYCSENPYYRGAERPKARRSRRN